MGQLQASYKAHKLRLTVQLLQDNIIYLNRVDSAWVNGKVLVLDDGREEEAQIEGRVAQGPSNVQKKKIKIEAYDTASPEGEKHLQKGEE